MAKGDVAIFIALLLTAGLFWAADRLYPDLLLERITLTVFAVAVIYFLLRPGAERVLTRAVGSEMARYSVRKAVSIISLVLILAVVIRIWVEDPRTLLLSYGIIAAGLAIALQDVFKDFVGSLVILVARPFGIGDRVEIEGHAGDVIDIGLLNTVLMEIGGWVSGDQPNGRITSVPNSAIISGAVSNYTRDFTFLWDEVTVPVAYGGDWKEAAETFLAIAREETEEAVRAAGQEIDRIRQEYYLTRRSVEPMAFVALTDNWVGVTVRYIAPVMERRAVKDRISRAVLAAAEASESFRVASATLEIGGALAVGSQPISTRMPTGRPGEREDGPGNRRPAGE
ncbi:mechanosensitive ion channel family protein [Methanofollis ethanolicus]|uniref:mechanosensitive ion channel family protein n=1 Tax=Methanofollis ethanolicus TaxID=488124 RepID=UPI000830AD6A|nr:mechanosensitive ion channel domain-containing protein [Methanofollis ethanolicus]